MGHLVMTMAAIMKMYVLTEASNMVHLTCRKMTKRDVSNYTQESTEIHQEFIKKLLKWIVQKKIRLVFWVFLCVHNYHSWDSPCFVGFKQRCAHILQNSPRDAKCTGLFRAIKI
jgi:hypothetical protein